MQFAVLIKPLFKLLTLVAAITIGGGIAILTHVEKPIHINNPYHYNVTSPNISEWNYNYAILEEKITEDYINKVTNQPLKVRCKLVDGENIEWCLLSKLQVPANQTNKWIHMHTLKTTKYDTHLPSDYISKSKTIYKVSLTWTFIDEWKLSPHKQLNIFPTNYNPSAINPLEPLTTLTPVLSIKTKTFQGKSKYILGKVTGVTNSSGNTDTSMTTKNKFFKCELPEGDTRLQDCQIYIFDADDHPNKNFDNKELKVPLTITPSITKDLHYIVKFKDEVDIRDTIYYQTSILKATVFDDLAGNIQAKSGITEISFSHLSNVLVFEDNTDIELVVVV